MRGRLSDVSAPVSPDPGDTAETPAAAPPRAIRDPRSETGVSTRRLRHLIGRGLDVLVLLAIDLFGITAAIYSGLVLRELLNNRPVYWDQLWSAEREWLPFVLLVSVLIFARNGLYRPREMRPGGAQIVAGLFVAVVVIAIFSVVVVNCFTKLTSPYTGESDRS